MTPGRAGGMLALLLLVAVALVGGNWCLRVAERAPAAGSSAAPPAPRAPAAVTLLREWDARRAAAWASADPSALAALYSHGSSAGRRDVAMLRRWTSRGLRVEGLTTQLVAVQVVTRTPHCWRLRVTDRVSSAVARGPGLRVALPSDHPSTRLVTLTRVHHTWRVAGVRTLRPAPPRPHRGRRCR